MADMKVTGCPSTDDQTWNDTFQPITKYDEDIRFEDEGDEGAFLDFFSDEHIWTQTEANDVIYYEAGRTGINAVGYIVCVIPWTTAISFAVEYRTEDGEPPRWMKDQDADLEEGS